MPTPGHIVLLDPDGNPHEVPHESAASALSSGWRVQTDRDVANRLAAEGDEEDYGGVGGTIAATGAGLARMVTLGASDAVIDAAGGGEELRNLREQNPTASLVGEFAGAFVPGGLAARAGKVAAEARVAAEGASLGTRVGAAAAGTAFEGAALGAGAGVSELALSDDPLTVERVASVLSSNMLFGAATGGVLGAGSKLVETGLLKAKSALEARKTAAAASAKVSDDLVGLDAKQLRAAREAELVAIEASRAPQRVQLAEDLATFRKELKDQKLWLATKGAEEREIREAGRISLKADRELDRALNNPKALADNPKRALAALQQQEHALEQIAKNADIIRAKVSQQRSAFDDVAGLKSMGAEADALAAAERAAISAPGKTRMAALDGVAPALERNRALQARIGELAGDPVSARLKAIDDAKDALVTGAAAPKSLPEQLLQGGVFSAATGLASPLGPLAPIVGAAAAKAATGGIFGKLAKAGDDVAARTQAAVTKFLDVGARGAKAAPVLATKTLAAVRYAPGDEKARKKGPSGQLPTLATSFRARSAEIRSQTAYGPDGRAVLRPEARTKMGEQLGAIRAVSPLLADRIETIAARRLEFLANELPRRPDLGVIPTGPDKWQPSDLAMRRFARMAAAVEDPAGIAERLVDGTVTSEDAKVMREVYPEQLADLQQRVITELPMLRKQLPYERRIALSILTGLPVDPAMNPRILKVLQGHFPAEDGSDGDVGPPTAKPQFGSVRSDAGSAITPAQSRAQGEST
jgi:hypothetical protein